MPKKITDPEEIARLDALASEKAQESAPAPDPFAHYERMQQAVPVNPYRQAPPLPDEMWDAPPMRWAEGVLGMVPGAGEAASINPMGPPDTPVEQIAHGAGIATGIGGMLAAGGPLTAPLGEYVGGTVAATQYAPLAPMLANIAKTAPLFAGHGALEPGTPMERLEHAAGGANIAVEMAALGNIPGVRQAFSKPYTRVPAVGGYFTAKEVADGADPQESFFRNMGMAAGMEVGGVLEQKPQSPRLQRTPAEMEVPEFYRGTKVGDTRRIKTGNAEWDGYTFVTESPENARWYGPNIERVRLAPGSRVLKEGTPEFERVVGEWREGENLLEYSARAARTAKEAGYDAVHFERQTDVGTAILNESAIVERSPYRPPEVKPEAEQVTRTPYKDDGGGRRAQRRENLGELREAQTEPVPNNKASELTTEFRNTDSIAGLVDRLASGELRATPTPERLREIETQIKRERNYDLNPNEPKPTVQEAARTRAQRELIPDELAEFIDKQAELVKAPEGDPHGADPSKSPLNNITTGKAEFIDPVRLMQSLGGGEAGYPNLMDKHITRPNQEANLSTWRIKAKANDVVRDVMGEIKQGSPEDLALGKAKNALPDGMNTAEFWKTQEGVDILSGVPTPDGRQMVMDALPSYRALFRNMYEQLNAVSIGSGGEPVPYLDKYFPKLEMRPGALDIKGKAERAAAPYEVNTGNKSGNPEFFNPRRLHRTDKPIERDWSAWRAADDYAARFSESIGHQVALSNNMAIANYLDAKGFGGAATIVRNYTQSVYNKQPYGLHAWTSQKSASGGKTGQALSALRWHRARLNDAVFLANIGWNLVVQPSSAALAGARGTRPAIKALETMVDPEFRKFVNEEVYTQIAKNKDQGGVASEGVSGDPVSQDSAMPKTRWQKTRSVLQKPAATVERETGFYSAAVAYEQGKMLDLKGRELIDFMSDGIAKTQSVYDRYGRAEFLNSKEMHGIAPFQSFATEVMNSNREMMGNKVGQYKLYEGAGAKTGYMARQIVGMAIANAVAGIVAGRELYDEKAFLPFWTYLTGESKSNPGSLMSDLARIPDDIKKGRPGSAFSRFARHYLPAGVLMSRIANTLEAWSDEDAKYSIEDDEVPQSLIFGPYSTESADEYYNGSDDDKERMRRTRQRRQPRRKRR